MVKTVSDLDGSNQAVAIAVLTLLQKAKANGAEVPDGATEKFNKASPIVAALAKPRAGSRQKGGQ